MSDTISRRHQFEQKFHDRWASDLDSALLDVVKINEADTAPEIRYILGQLGPLEGKKLIDVGCGLGEASVYFAIKGAEVTSVDISEGMLQSVERLALKYQVKVRTFKLNVEAGFPDDKFDIVYAGNLLHHVEVEATLKKLALLIKDGGLLATWDPLAYNPFINVYRFIARKVRTPDEHPFKKKDIALFKKYFSDVKVRYFWLFSLTVFLCMALVQFRNPNKERFWKAVVEEGERWRWLYRPLEALDTFILRLFPGLGLLCWNVVILARKK